MNSRANLLLGLLLSHFLPLALAVVFFRVSPESSFWTIAAVAVLVSVIFSASWYLTIIKPVKLLERRTQGALVGNYLTAKELPAGGLFTAVISNINQLIIKLQEALNRSQTEADVIASEANRLRMILNSINDGVLALDSNKQIVLFNRAASKITSLSIEEVAGKHINDILPLLKSRQVVLSDWISSCEGSDMQSQSWEGLTFSSPKTGEHLALDVEALYVGADPNGVRTLVTFHNRTKEQQIEDMKVDFVALAAHELRTPVTVIRGYLEILEEEIGPQISPEHQEFIRRLAVSTNQLSGSINNILHVSHIEHGELNLHKEASDWKEIVATVCDGLVNKAETQDKRLIVRLPDKLPLVSVDRVSINEVITNLVDNAIKYSSRGQSITVQVSARENKIITEVIDQGSGIPSNAIGKLFTKFYRSHRTSSSHRGTGLGLYVSKAIVEAHGGHIWVESKEGEGSTFGFELPEFAKDGQDSDNSNITRGVHGWIKNHSLYKG